MAKNTRTKENDPRLIGPVEIEVLKDPKIRLVKEVLDLSRTKRGGDFTSTILFLSYGLEKGYGQNRSLSTMRVIDELRDDDINTHRNLRIFIKNAVTMNSLEIGFGFRRPFSFTSHVPFYMTVLMGSYNLEVHLHGQSAGAFKNVPSLVYADHDLWLYHQEFVEFYEKLGHVHEFNDVLEFEPTKFKTVLNSYAQTVKEFPKGGKALNSTQKDKLVPYLCMHGLYLQFFVRHLSNCQRCTKQFLRHNVGTKIEKALSMITGNLGINRYRKVHEIDSNIKRVCSANSACLSVFKLRKDVRESGSQANHFRALANQVLPGSCQYMSFQCKHDDSHNIKSRIVDVGADTEFLTGDLKESYEKEVAAEKLAREETATKKKGSPKKNQAPIKKRARPDDVTLTDEKSSDSEDETKPSTSGPPPARRREQGFDDIFAALSTAPKKNGNAAAKKTVSAADDVVSAPKDKDPIAVSTKSPPPKKKKTTVVEQIGKPSTPQPARNTDVIRERPSAMSDARDARGKAHESSGDSSDDSSDYGHEKKKKEALIRFQSSDDDAGGVSRAGTTLDSSNVLGVHREVQRGAGSSIEPYFGLSEIAVDDVTKETSGGTSNDKDPIADSDSKESVKDDDDPENEQSTPQPAPQKTLYNWLFG